MNKNIVEVHTSFFKNAKAITVFVLAVFILPLIFTSCEIDGDAPIGGGGSGSSQFVGTWTKQIQWAYTDGLRDDTYTLRKGGTGSYKWWDWSDQRYCTTSLVWTAYGDYIIISRRDTQDISFSDMSGYISDSGSAIKIGNDWYYKQ